MRHKINYTFTFRLPENPGYLSDTLWSRALMTYLILATTRYEPELNEGLMAAYVRLPPAGQSELREAIDRGLEDLLEQESGKRLTQFAEENILQMVVSVFGPWIKLFVLVQEVDE